MPDSKPLSLPHTVLVYRVLATNTSITANWRIVLFHCSSPTKNCLLLKKQSVKVESFSLLFNSIKLTADSRGNTTLIPIALFILVAYIGISFIRSSVAYIIINKHTHFHKYIYNLAISYNIVMYHFLMFFLIVKSILCLEEVLVIIKKQFNMKLRDNQMKEGHSAALPDLPRVLQLHAVVQQQHV